MLVLSVTQNTKEIKRILMNIKGGTCTWNESNLI